MPGVPFSKACELCKKRRVKCDERKPACSQCIRIGKDCPGYQREAKFVDEAPRLQRRRDAASRSTRGGSSAGPSRRHSPLDMEISSQPLSPVASPESALRGFELLLMSHLPTVNAARLHAVMEAPPDPMALSRTLEKAEVMPSYVAYIPQRMGISQSLDTAVDCVFSAASYIATSTATERVQLGLLRKYGTALSYLREAIQDPVESMSAEVLAAVSLLSVYECLQSSQLTAWINHQQGIYKLVERRGPERYSTDFERQLLLASLGPIFTIALRNDHPCFLEEPVWQQIIFSKPPDSIIESEWTDTWEVVPMMCLVPRLMTECRSILRNHSSGKATESEAVEKIKRLAEAADDLRQSLLNMADRHGWQAGRYFPVLAPREPREHYRVFFDHEDQRAANFTNYLSALAIVNRILIAVRPSMHWLEQKNRRCALEIQYIHSFIKSQDRLREIYLVHSERVALAILLTSGYWSGSRDPEGGSAFDPSFSDGGKLIDEWKWDAFDDILCARKIDAPLMFHYEGPAGGSTSSQDGRASSIWT